LRDAEAILIFLDMGKPPLEIVAYSIALFFPFRLKQNNQSEQPRWASPSFLLSSGRIFNLFCHNGMRAEKCYPNSWCFCRSRPRIPINRCCLDDSRVRTVCCGWCLVFPFLTSPTELAVGGSRFFRSGRLKRSETVGRRPSMPENVIATLIQPQKSTKTRPKERRLPPFQQSCHLLGYPRAQLRRGCGSQHVPASQLVPDHTKHAS